MAMKKLPFGRGGGGANGNGTGRAPGGAGGGAAQAAPAKDLVAAAATDWPRIAAQFRGEGYGPSGGPVGLELKPEQLRTFPQLPGSDDEPWDVLLSMLALDEH